MCGEGNGRHGSTSVVKLTNLRFKYGCCEKFDQEVVFDCCCMYMLLFFTFMQCIYNYIPKTNHVSVVYSVAAVLYLQFVLHVMFACEMYFVLLH